MLILKATTAAATTAIDPGEFETKQRGQVSGALFDTQGAILSSEPFACRKTSGCLEVVDSLPPAPVPLPDSPIAPPSSIAPATHAIGPNFAARVSNSWCLAAIIGNAISASFSPNLSDLGELNALAVLGGFDHFNIEQDISDISGNVSLGTLPRWTGVDPALGGNSFAQFDDQFPWYYDEVATAGEWMPLYNNPSIFTFDASGAAIGLNWRDAPNLGPQNAGVTLTFTDYLVGVYADHTGVRISQAFPNTQNVNFVWTFTQGAWGANAPSLMRFARFDQSERGSDGSVQFLGYFGSDPCHLSPTGGNTCQPLSEPTRKQRHLERLPEAH